MIDKQSGLLIIAAHQQNPPSISGSSFRVPMVPIVPAISILLNIGLMFHLSLLTWLRFLVWMVIGKYIVSLNANCLPIHSINITWVLLCSLYRLTDLLSVRDSLQQRSHRSINLCRIDGKR